MIYILNSAVMPAGSYGTYTYEPAAIDTLRAVLAGPEGSWASRIGYAQNVDLIERWTGVRVPLDRSEVTFSDGDQALVMRLRRRVADPTTKGAPVSEAPEDWQFAWVTFRAPAVTEPAVTWTWTNKQAPRDRQAWCLLVKGDEVIPFAGESIPGVVAVVGRDYAKDGKWSHSTFRLVLAEGVRMIAGHEGWGTGTFAEGLASALKRGPVDSWQDMADALGVSREAANRFLRGWRPPAADALDERERAVASLETIPNVR